MWQCPLLIVSHKHTLKSLNPYKMPCIKLKGSDASSKILLNLIAFTKYHSQALWSDARVWCTHAKSLVCFNAFYPIHVITLWPGNMLNPCNQLHRVGREKRSRTVRSTAISRTSGQLDKEICLGSSQWMTVRESPSRMIFGLTNLLWTTFSASQAARSSVRGTEDEWKARAPAYNNLPRWSRITKTLQAISSLTETSKLTFNQPWGGGIQHTKAGSWAGGLLEPRMSQDMS